MRIKASFFGPIRRPWPEQAREVEVEEGTVIQAFLESLGYQADDMRRVAVVVNGKRKTIDASLKEGDDLRFVLLAGGG
jgi:sulfur carrier protein ThiS